MLLRKGVAVAMVFGMSGPIPTCFAQTESGVTVDPQSPAGKEYALPIDRARRDATGEAVAPRGSTPAPAFGAGVKPDAGAATQSPRKTAGTSTAPETSRSDAAPSGGGGSAPTTREVKREGQNVDRELVKASIRTSSDGSGSPAILLGGLALVAVGAAAGLLIRKRTS